MNKKHRIAAFFAAVVMLFAVLPGFAAEAADYNAHDVEKLTAFFSIKGLSPYTNGRAINGENFDISDPATWTCCTWNDAGRLVSLEFENLGWEVVGELDLAGCDALETLFTTDCQISELDLAGCTALRMVDVTGNRLTSLSTADNHDLELLWFKQNSVTQIDLSANPLLYSLDCSYNGISEIDVSVCPLLTVLRASNNSLTELDISANPLITDLNVKTNLLEELDVSHLTGLTRLTSFNNRFRRLDISVLNGGEPFVLEAVGRGFVGTKVFTDSQGNPVIHASSNAEAGESFLGWYVGDELISTSEHIPCTFGVNSGLQAHFTGEEPQLQLGDVDASGHVDSADALLLLRYSMHLVDESALHLEVADMNADGTVNSADALAILRFAMGLLG
ncbi:MAG: hypothetical protein IKS43_06795 [Clostridia bacterium]|nr:hypothetical protein [Clostridia bacterium]